MNWLINITITIAGVGAMYLINTSYQHGFNDGLKTAQDIISSYSTFMEHGINLQKELKKQ